MYSVWIRHIHISTSTKSEQSKGLLRSLPDPMHLLKVTGNYLQMYTTVDTLVKLETDGKKVWLKDKIIQDSLSSSSRGTALWAKYISHSCTNLFDSLLQCIVLQILNLVQVPRLVMRLRFGAVIQTLKFKLPWNWNIQQAQCNGLTKIFILPALLLFL